MSPSLSGMFFKNYLGCFGVTYFFLFNAYITTLFLVSLWSRKREKKKPKDVNLGRNITGLRKPLAERPKLTADCGPKPIFLLGMSWWSTEDVVEEVKEGTLQGAVCSFLSTVKEMNSKDVKIFKLVWYLDPLLQTCLPQIRILMWWVPPVSRYSCSFGWWLSC